MKLCNTYEQNTPSNKVFLMHKLFNLRMKENGNVAHHINDFESTFAQIHAERMNLDDELKAIFLLYSLLASWDMFCTAVIVILHPMAILCMVTSLELFSMKNQDARLQAIHIMVKLIMCRERANRDKVAVNSAMILTGMARRMHHVAIQSLVARKTYNVIFVTSLVT